MTAMTGMSALLISLGLEFELRQRRSTARRRHADFHGPGARHAQVHGRVVGAGFLARTRSRVRSRHPRHPHGHLNLGIPYGSPRCVLHLDVEPGLATRGMGGTVERLIRRSPAGPVGACATLSSFFWPGMSSVVPRMPDIPLCASPSASRADVAALVSLTR